MYTTLYVLGQSDEPNEDANVAAPFDGLHGSLMVALEHSSGVVRTRAVEQLARAISIAVTSNEHEGAYCIYLWGRSM